MLKLLAIVLVSAQKMLVRQLHVNNICKNLDLDLFVGYMSDQDLKKGQMIPYKIVPQFAN